MKKFIAALNIASIILLLKVGDTFASVLPGDGSGGGSGGIFQTPPSVTIASPFNNGSANSIITTVISKASIIILFLIGAVFMGMIIYGGFLFLVDGGNEENAKKARGVIMAAIIGLVIIGVTGFVLKLIESIFGVNLNV